MRPREASPDGAKVRVFNERGSTILPGRVTDRIARGVVCLKEGAWFNSPGTERAARGPRPSQCFGLDK
jgi:anaerobic dimethyl sulfoxide reductase subunit A